MKNEKVTFRPNPDEKNLTHFRKLSRVRDTTPLSSTHGDRSMLAVKNGKDIVTLVTVRVYHKPKAATVTCLAWVWLNGNIYYGAAKASGTGYDRRSTAVTEALTAAGFQNLGDGGQGAIMSAGRCIAALTPGVNKNSLYLHDAHA